MAANICQSCPGSGQNCPIFVFHPLKDLLDVWPDTCMWLGQRTFWPLVHYPCQTREQSTVLERPQWVRTPRPLHLLMAILCACVRDGAYCNISHSWFLCFIIKLLLSLFIVLFCFGFLEICTWMHTAWKEYGHFWTTENEGIWQGATDCSREPRNTAENKRLMQRRNESSTEWLQQRIRGLRKEWKNVAEKERIQHGVH